MSLKGAHVLLSGFDAYAKKTGKMKIIKDPLAQLVTDNSLLYDNQEGIIMAQHENNSYDIAVQGAILQEVPRECVVLMPGVMPAAGYATPAFADTELIATIAPSTTRTTTTVQPPQASTTGSETIATATSSWATEPAA